VAIMLDYVHFYLLYVFKKLGIYDCLEAKQILWKYLVIVVSIASCSIVVFIVERVPCCKLHCYTEENED